MSNTYCPLPWNHFSADANGSMRVCCNSTADGRLKNNNGELIQLTNIENILNFYNIDHLKNIRKNMIDGKRTQDCDYCYAVEDNGGVSVRQWFVNRWPMESVISNTDLSTGAVNDVNINYLDLSWSNKCNLQCKMCTPNASNQLIEEFKFIDNDQWSNAIDFKDRWNYDNIKFVLDKTITDKLTQILVTGGEPLINNDFYSFCQMLINTGISKQIEMSIHTNLTVTPQKWFDIWRHFRSITIKISIDAVEEVYEYIRHPGKWNIVKQNIKDTIEFSKNNNNIGIEFHTVLSIFNTERFTDLLDYIALLDGNNIIRVPHINYIHIPNYASPSNLPTEYKTKIYNDIITWIDSNMDKFINDSRCVEKISVLRSVANILLQSETNNEQKNNCYEIITKMDNYRKHNTLQFLPWFSNAK
jgi:pyruvate-formate lyase-activating enzyme